MIGLGFCGLGSVGIIHHKEHREHKERLVVCMGIDRMIGDRIIMT